MGITLFISPMCDNCIGVEEEVRHLAEIYSLSVAICLVEKNMRTGEVVVFDDENNMMACPDIPGVPAVLFMNRLFVGNDCCAALYEILANEKVVVD